MMFIPYGKEVVDELSGGTFKICQLCGEWVLLFERKDFESFSGVEYRGHYLQHLRCPIALLTRDCPFGHEWIEDVPYHNSMSTHREALEGYSVNDINDMESQLKKGAQIRK